MLFVHQLSNKHLLRCTVTCTELNAKLWFCTTPSYCV